MSERRPRLMLRVIVVLGLVAAAACTPGRKSDPKAQGSIRIEAAEPGSLDPPHADDPDEVTIVGDIFSALVSYDAKTGAVRPASAKAWQISADAKQFTF